MGFKRSFYISRLDGDWRNEAQWKVSLLWSRCSVGPLPPQTIIVGSCLGLIWLVWD